MATLYTQIKEDLLAKIDEGVYAEGDVIPSEVDLAKDYGVSRPTVRQALRILESEGYIDRRKRRGTVVASRLPHEQDKSLPLPAFGRPSRPGVQSFEDEIAASGKEVSTMPILVKHEIATAEVASALNIEPGAPVAKVVRLRYVDGTPNVFMESYVPEEILPGFIDGVDFSRTRLYERMRELGHAVCVVSRRIDVMCADYSLSMLLDIAVGEPLFLLRTIGKDKDGTVVEYSISNYRGNSNSFEFTVENAAEGAVELSDGALPDSREQGLPVGMI